MKITKINFRGEIRWRVNEPSGPDGKRKRTWFRTREAAEQYTKERTADTKAFGVHFASIPTGERAVIAYQLQRLAALGWTLALPSPPDVAPASIRSPVKRRIKREDIAEALEYGSRSVPRGEAVAKLQTLAFHKTVAYKALSASGRFAEFIEIAPDGLIEWKA